MQIIDDGIRGAGGGEGFMKCALQISHLNWRLHPFFETAWKMSPSIMVAVVKHTRFVCKPKRLYKISTSVEGRRRLVWGGGEGERL